MKETAELTAAIAQLLWPLLCAGLIWLLRREIRGLIQPGTELAVELFGNKLQIRPTKPPEEKSKLPAVEDRDQLPADYIYLNHTSFLREELQEEFQGRTGVLLPHYDIRVIVDSYYLGALDNIEKVEYVLHDAYPNPFQIRIHKEDRFLLKELANGEYVLLAKVSLKDRKGPLVLQRYITLRKDGPRLE